MIWPRDPAVQRPLPATLPHGKTWPRISVVTPSFNQGAFIEETILSVLNQGYPAVEHIIVDGGSTDGTTGVLDRYRDRLAGVVRETDRGQSHAINKGMARATGEILTWLNSDDRLAPGALSAMAMAFHTSGADMVAGICELWREGHMTERHLTSCEDGPLPLDDLLDLDGAWNAGQFFFQPEVFFTRDLWNRAGGRVDEDSFYSMDYELWLRFAAAGAVLKVIGRPVTQFRIHPGQKTADPRLFQAELPLTRQRFLDTRGISAEERSPGPAPRLARIVFFNDIGVRYGAGIAHGRLAAAAVMAGHEVSVIAASAESRPSGLSADEQQQQLQAIDSAAPDLVIVGNLHAAGLPPSFLAAITKRWLTAFVVHDLWIVTGRCAYTNGCEKLLPGCDESCPTPAEYPALSPSLIAPAWSVKRQLLCSDRAPLLLTNSEWTRSQVRRALGGDGPASRTAQAITLGVGDQFVPVENRTCRQLLGLPDDAFLILLSATSLSDPRKGRDHLLQALSRLKLSDVELVLVGSGEDDVVPGFRVHRFVYQTDPKTLAMIYAACDLFVGPSLEECLGQVFLEAAACGVPSIGYAVGGVPEAVTDGVTGLLAREATPHGLADAILRIHGDAELRSALSIWARLAFENERTLESSYHRLHGVLRRHMPGGDTLFGRKISLHPPQSVHKEGGPDTWEALSGFGPWEGPYPEWNLPRCRWQDARLGAFHVMARANGPHTLVLRYRNRAPHQQLRVTCGGQEAFRGPVPVGSNLEDSQLKLDVDLEAPRTLVTCEASSSLQSPEGRSQTLLLCGVEVTPASRVRAATHERGRFWKTAVALPGRSLAWLVRSRR
jgi:glycosyltransferase involved in cell wall biosynthesis